MPATERRGRHAAPGGFSPLRAAALPCALLGATGAAFVGLTLVPASATDAPRVVAAQALAPVELPAWVPEAEPNVALGAALERGLQDAVAQERAQQDAVAQERAQQDAVAQERAQQDRAGQERAQRASRSRGVTTAKPEAAAAKALFVRPGEGRLTSAYGRRWGRLHAGIDLAAGVGSPVRAVAAGVVKSGGAESGYGKTVRIIHADGTESVYAHMSRITVADGERVAAGELVGREGNTGQSTGPHLHFEVRINGTPVDPVGWLRKRGVAV